ncbi:MAG: methionyl-tRNA formyltransferase, partial [Candidatus Aminicenantales bacterium]
MKVVFFGSPRSALPALERLIESGHEIILAITQPDRPAGRGREPMPPPVKEAALGRGIPVLQPEKIRTDPRILETLKAAAPDINVVVAYGQIIPPAIIDLPRFKSINVHFSLLPKYRGAAPVQWAILNGEEKTGVTIFELNERMDEGDILSLMEVDIQPREKADELEVRLSRLGSDLLVKTLDEIEDLPRVPQDHALATPAPRLHKDQGRIDWTKECVSIDRMVRAFSPWPGAHTFFHGRRLVVHEGIPLPAPDPVPQPGRIIEIRKEGPLVS